jgi:hypothetical protein
MNATRAKQLGAPEPIARKVIAFVSRQPSHPRSLNVNEWVCSNQPALMKAPAIPVSGATKPIERVSLISDWGSY